MKKAMSCEEREVRFVEDAWLNYFNRYLYDNEIISEKQYKQMTGMIASRKTKISSRKNAM